MFSVHYKIQEGLRFGKTEPNHFIDRVYTEHNQTFDGLQPMDFTAKDGVIDLLAEKHCIKEKHRIVVCGVFFGTRLTKHTIKLDQE